MAAAERVAVERAETVVCKAVVALAAILGNHHVVVISHVANDPTGTSAKVVSCPVRAWAASNNASGCSRPR